MTNSSQELYNTYHEEFESWINEVHPNHDWTFEWESGHDSGWYKQDLTQGAWITWLRIKVYLSG